MKSIRRVEIEWTDSVVDKGWRWISEVVANRKEGYEPMKTIGYLVYEDKQMITVAQSLHFEIDAKDTNRGADFMTIPRGCIKKIIKL